MNNSIIISKYRIEFWFLESFTILILLFVIWICFYFSPKYGPIDFKNPFIWIVCVIIPIVPIQIYNLAYSIIKKITVTDEGIIVNYFIVKKTCLVSFNNIVNCTTSRIIHYGNIGWAGGYYQLSIETNDGQSIVFDEYQFANFDEMMIKIVKGYNKEL